MKYGVEAVRKQFMMSEDSQVNKQSKFDTLLDHSIFVLPIVTYEKKDLFTIILHYVSKVTTRLMM